MSHLLDLARAGRHSVAKSPSGPLPPDLMALIERVAAHFNCPPDELPLMVEVARGDVSAAWDGFTATAQAEGLL